ncbi:hypothetical protein SCLCIDRAFT_1220621 [Scleroderma citrinum Foug A]|uniref:Uncharacterized protein n=1 Tax=Scleroderma citrinum Foug A TaxID=1036808 RepID=A0A0C3DHY6_9AGAM|nr:hypothetical protein SCLCIDRAFT_1220621 [Scleroderma citrinum Foug A]
MGDVFDPPIVRSAPKNFLPVTFTRTTVSNLTLEGMKNTRAQSIRRISLKSTRLHQRTADRTEADEVGDIVVDPD